MAKSKKKSKKKPAKTTAVRKCTVCRKRGHNARSHKRGARNPQ
jgi:hypothetical protein